MIDEMGLPIPFYLYSQNLTLNEVLILMLRKNHIDKTNEQIKNILENKFYLKDSREESFMQKFSKSFYIQINSPYKIIFIGINYNKDKSFNFGILLNPEISHIYPSDLTYTFLNIQHILDEEFCLNYCRVIYYLLYSTNVSEDYKGSEELLLLNRVWVKIIENLDKYQMKILLEREL